MDDDRTKAPPFPDDTRTGWAFIPPCRTSSVREFLIDGAYWLAGHVVGHGWSQPWPGRIQDTNDTGTIICPHGTEQPVHRRCRGAAE